MEKEEVKIKLYDKRGKSTTMYVEQLAENKFRMTDNNIWNCRLTLGTEFETRINQYGKYEIRVSVHLNPSCKLGFVVRPLDKKLGHE